MPFRPRMGAEKAGLAAGILYNRALWFGAVETRPMKYLIGAVAVALSVIGISCGGNAPVEKETALGVVSLRVAPMASEPSRMAAGTASAITTCSHDFVTCW